jgi:hypothetical protein
MYLMHQKAQFQMQGGEQDARQHNPEHGLRGRVTGMNTGKGSMQESGYRPAGSDCYGIIRHYRLAT